MSRLPRPPVPEPPIQRDIDVLPPRMQVKVLNVIKRMDAKGWMTNGKSDCVVNEVERTDERQQWLYGCGREYDPDGRGVVTNVKTARNGWHFYRLALDFAHRTISYRKIPTKFWDDLVECVIAEGLTSGNDWNRNNIPDDEENGKRIDKPHAQWWVPGMRVSPSDRASELYDSGGFEAVWRAVGAID